MEDQPSSNSSTQQQATTAKPIIPCTICGVPSRGFIYGAVACEACKAFFKRKAENGLETLKCHYDGHCEININTRHTCSYCRLAKCFANGMQKELLRCSHSTTNRNEKKRQKNDDEVQILSTVPRRTNPLSLIPTLNLLRSDQSTLSADQWNLLSNLTHCYDEHAGLSIGEKYILEQNNLPPKLRFKGASIIQLYQVALEAAQSLYKNNGDFHSLSSDDRSVILHSTSTYTGCISSNYICYKIGLLENPSYYDAIEISCSATISNIARRYPSRLNFDVTIMKLLLVILSFSTFKLTGFPNTSSSTLSNIQDVLHIQDKYIEITWRYLLYKYDHERAVKCFSDFIRCIFTVNEAIIEGQRVQWFTSTMDSITQKTAQTLSANG